MSRRIWMILAADLAAGAAFGGAILAGGGSSPSVFQSSPSASWGLFSPAQWQTVQTRFVRRGFEPAGLRVVGGMMLLPQRRPLALVAGTNKGRECVVPVRGVQLGPTTCDVDRPLVLFGPRHATMGLLGLVGSGVVGVSATDRAGRVTGLPLIQVGAILTFADTFAGTVTLRAYGKGGRVLARVDLAA